MDDVAEMNAARRALEGPTETVNLYILSPSSVWQGPFESMEHIQCDATISGRVVRVSVSARPLGHHVPNAD